MDGPCCCLEGIFRYDDFWDPWRGYVQERCSIRPNEDHEHG
uniref:Uncharacterized protein n=1 Tax=Arundo donax TaxID=35708 RepID=A0A0A9FFL9_ARUDO